jgi:biopolymer transport protein ExbD
MNFRPGSRDEPEINLIPFIDVLLVVLIFLMLTTTYSKFTQLQVNLPVADAQTQRSMPKEVVVAVSSDGRYAINQQLLEGASVEVLTRALQEASQDTREIVIIISADAAATHQSVINVMDAARRAGLVQITFATQQSGTAPARGKS